MAESEGHLPLTNGHKAKAYENIAKETGGLFVAEFVSMAVSLGVVAVVDDLAPNMMKKATNFVAKNLVTPFQDNIEWGLSKFCRLKECQIDYSKSREERAQGYAHFLTVFGAAFVPSMIAKLGTRMAINKLLTVESDYVKTGNFWKDHILPSKNDWGVIAADEGLHLGSILVMNTVGAPVTDRVLDSTTSMIQKTFNCSEQKAKQVAEMAVIWEAPNWLGFTGGVGQIYNHHMSKLAIPAATHVEKLAASRTATDVPKLLAP